MAATSIFFNGRLIRTPGSYSQVDASGLATFGLSAAGILAVIGKSLGGVPYTAVSGDDIKGQLQVATGPQQPFEFFRGGDLREAGPIAFEPANDEDVPQGAQEIVFVKCNPATRSTGSFGNGDGQALVLNSKDYGYHTRQIKVAIGSGTLKGKAFTFTFEATTETFDDVGGDDFFSLTFAATSPSDGYSTLTATLTAAMISTAFTVARTGLDTDLVGQCDPGGGYEIVSSGAGDTTQTVTTYGLTDANVAQAETLTCAGVTPVPSGKTWNKIHGSIISAAPAGTVTLRKPSAGASILTLTAANRSKGLHALSDVSVAGEVLSLVLGGAGTERVTIVGFAPGGASQLEAVQLAGAVPVLSSGSWIRATYLALGELAAAKTLTLSAKSVNATLSGYNTLQKVADLFNSTTGYTLALLTGQTSLNPANLDRYTSVNIKGPAVATFRADLYTIVETLTAQSQFITATRGTPGTGAPSNTVASVFLTGGHEGSSTPGQEAVPTATSNDWQAAFNLLKKVYVNTVVPLTPDPAIHAQAKAHAAYMCGAGRKERDVVVGLMNTAMTGLATKAEIKSQIVNLNSRHVRAFAQQIDRYNTSGERETMAPHFGAVMVGGMQCGAAVGTPLTHKVCNILRIQQSSGWNPVDNVEEMIEAGLLFAETLDGIGRRIVRNVTTHLTTSNIAYVEGSVNHALNYSVYNYRTALETFVGKAGFAGTVTAARSGAVKAAEALLGVSLIAYRSLMVTMLLDVIETAIEMAPVLPVNFVKNTIHAVAVQQTAAAA